MRKRPSVDSWISKSWHSLSQPAGWSRLTSLLVKHFVGRQDILNMIVAITSFTITSHIQARSHPLPPGRPLLWPCTQVFVRNVQQKVLIKIHWGFIKWWAEANNFQCCPRAEGPRATLEIIGWGSPLDNFIVKLQTLAPGRRHWTILPARQRRLLSSRQSC